MNGNRIMCIVIILILCFNIINVYAEKDSENILATIELNNNEEFSLFPLCDQLDIKYEWMTAEYNYPSNEYLVLHKNDMWSNLYFSKVFYPKSLEYDAFYISEGLTSFNDVKIKYEYIDDILGLYGFTSILDNNKNEIKIIQCPKNDILVNGNKIGNTGEIIINNGTTLPFRSLFEALGAEVKWDNETKIATATINDVIFKCDMSLCMLYVYKNNIEQSRSSVCRIVNSKIWFTDDILTKVLEWEIYKDSNGNINIVVE